MVRRKKENRFSYSRLFLGLLLAFSLALTSVVVVEYVNFSFVGKVFEKPHLIEIEDECGIIMGNLVHQLRDEIDCDLKCRARCEVEDSNYKSSEFFLNETSCNSCNCYCK